MDWGISFSRVWCVKVRIPAPFWNSNWTAVGFARVVFVLFNSTLEAHLIGRARLWENQCSTLPDQGRLVHLGHFENDRSTSCESFGFPVPIKECEKLEFSFP